MAPESPTHVGARATANAAAAAAAAAGALLQPADGELPPSPPAAGSGDSAAASSDDDRAQALEALSSASCRRIYETALEHLRSQFTYDAVTQQFMSILEHDDPYDSPCSVAHQDINAGKNRYRDVVPYDHNRVALPPLPGRSGSGAGAGAGAGGGGRASSGSGGRTDCGTYINASFLVDPCQLSSSNPAGNPDGNPHNHHQPQQQQLAPQPAPLGYIATQGPLPGTIADFWRMVAATNTSAIVMLTGLTDGSPTLGNSRPRCAPYFPEREQDRLELPGGLVVTCVHLNALDDNIFFRQLEVVWDEAASAALLAQPQPQQQQPQPKQQPQQQQPQQQPQQGGQLLLPAHQQPQQQPPQRLRLWINHYQYASWPDYGVPSSTASVLALCHALDGCRRAGCKLAVHCSAGVGRTGTFVAVDILLQRLHALSLQLPGSVPDGAVVAAMDIQGLVAALRKQRRGTVQTSEQYGFVWQAVMDELVALLRAQGVEVEPPPPLLDPDEPYALSPE